jgi:hypothetical protein
VTGGVEEGAGIVAASAAVVVTAAPHLLQNFVPSVS